VASGEVGGARARCYSSRWRPVSPGGSGGRAGRAELNEKVRNPGRRLSSRGFFIFFSPLLVMRVRRDPRRTSDGWLADG
jgi:hypothetical protein